MPDDEEGYGRARWRTHVPLAASAFVVLALLALAGTPVLMTWRIDALHADGDTTTGRAHLLTDSLRTLFVSEIILLEQVRKGDPHSGAHYRGVRSSQERVLLELRAVAPRISATATDRVNRVARLSARWHTVPDARRLTHALNRTIAVSEQRRVDLATIAESKSRLMRGFTHDVKNPIGAADGYLQLLEDGIFGSVVAAQRTGIERARRSLRAALHLIGDLLELEKVETGRISIDLVPMDVRAIAREAADLYRAQAEAKGLVLRIETNVEVPDILSDPMRVRQVLGNLISNAVKYTVTGEVAVRVGEEDDPESRGRLSISVADSGPGIAKDKQRLLFQEFVRLDPTAGRGAGIGLAMSARIAVALGGSITVRSDSGQGSVFMLWLAGE